MSEEETEIQVVAMHIVERDKNGFTVCAVEDEHHIHFIVDRSEHKITIQVSKDESVEISGNILEAFHRLMDAASESPEILMSPEDAQKAAFADLLSRCITPN